jgi:hypothetical protein
MDRQPRSLDRRGATNGLLLLTAALVALSCASVPPALRSRITVTGRVLVAGKPLPGTDISFTPTEFRPREIAFAIADSSGIYSVPLTSGTYDVEVTPPIGSGYVTLTKHLTVSPNHARLDFTFSGYRVTGRVMTPNGSVVDSGCVYAVANDSTRSGTMSQTKEGSYSLFLPHGRYSLQGGTANYWSGFYPARQESVPIEADTTIDFRLGGISVSGVVLGPDGFPMRDAGVEARSNSRFIQQRTDADGHYQLYVPPDSYLVRFSPPHPFYITSRVVGPLTITEPTSIDANLSGTEWIGTVQREGTNEPVPGMIVLVGREGDDRMAAITVGPRGEFRFILETGQRYGFQVYDPVRRERRDMLEGVIASSDTAFTFFVPPAITATRADTTVKLSIRSLDGKTVHPQRGRAPSRVEVTLQNTDPDTVTLVMPRNYSYWGGRTPLIDWEIHAPGGARLKPMSFGVCGNMDAVRAEEIFKLPPGANRTFVVWIPDYYRFEKSHRYQFRLSYENRPYLSSGIPRDRDVRHLLWQSTACKLVSNTLELKVK